MSGRYWLFRISIAANAFVLFYFVIYSTSPSSSSLSRTTNIPKDIKNSFTAIQQGSPTISGKHLYKISSSPLRDSNVPSSEQLQEIQPEQLKSELIIGNDELNQNELDGNNKIEQHQIWDGTIVGQNELKDTIDEGKRNAIINDGSSPDAQVEFEVQDANGSPNIVDGNAIINSDIGSAPSNVLTIKNQERIKLVACDDITPLKRFGQRGPFWVLYNYFIGRKRFKCDESITYTTHSDYTFLDNLIPLLERWEGPISLAMYTPSTDFSSTLKRIQYLRECVPGGSLIKDYVTIHFFFDYKNTPKYRIPKDPTILNFNCSDVNPDSVAFGEHLITFKKKSKLPYPVNVARNVAREMSTTHYIFPSDIELYPNPNLIEDFMNMIRKNDSKELQRPNPNKVFVLSIFEVEGNVTSLPQDKHELIYMLKNKSAIPFHKYICSNCHRIPKAQEWISSPIKSGLNVFHVGKRYKPFHHWEPIFIGTKNDPYYDERLTWEGRSDKMTQGYALCVLDYEFHILDNAFLVHRPGIKMKSTVQWKTPVVARQNSVISKMILPELQKLYGTRKGCVV